jgi:hypothetical protein
MKTEVSPSYHASIGRFDTLPDEFLRLYFADVSEVAIHSTACAEREFEPGACRFASQSAKLLPELLPT